MGSGFWWTVGMVRRLHFIEPSLSRRDHMMVARHEMPGSAASGNPSRRVRHDRLAAAFDGLSRLTNPGASDHTVPYGTDHFFARFSRHSTPGFLPSLWDKRLVSYVDAHGRLPDGPASKTDTDVQLEVRRTFGCVIRAAAKIIETPFDAPSG